MLSEDCRKFWDRLARIPPQEVLSDMRGAVILWNAVRTLWIRMDLRHVFHKLTARRPFQAEGYTVVCSVCGDRLLRYFSSLRTEIGYINEEYFKVKKDHPVSQFELWGLCINPYIHDNQGTPCKGKKKSSRT